MAKEKNTSKRLPTNASAHVKKAPLPKKSPDFADIQNAPSKELRATESKRDEQRQTNTSDINQTVQNDAIDARTNKGISPQSILWASSHFLLEPGSTVAMADCGRGSRANMLAHMNPHLNIVGLSHNKKAIEQANARFFADKEATDVPTLTNLSFSPILHDFTPDGKESEHSPYDAILNSFNLHYLYSIAGYSMSRITKYLATQLSQLKLGGTLVIQGYISPDNNENHYVLLELSDYKSNNQSLSKLSEAELLIRFAQTARPLDQSGCKGFYLEEITARIDHTRLFRLPAKWANEFLLRKDNRKRWDEEINKEYTPFTFESLQAEITTLGGRLVYYAPYWDKKTLEERYEPKCRIFDEEYNLLDFPPTSYTAVVQKIEKPGSVKIHERRPSHEKPNYLKVDHVIDETSGRIYDLVSRPQKLIDIIPFVRSKEGRITVFTRENYARPFVNTVPRKGRGLDGKYWSGHLIEPITVQIDKTDSIEEDDKRLQVIVETSTGLSLKEGGQTIHGAEYYPSPLMIDEKVKTIFVEVEKPEQNSFTVKHFEAGFHKEGHIKGFDAQAILKASHVGLLADGKLEIAIYNLLTTLHITPEVWMGGEMSIGYHTPKRRVEMDDIIRDITDKTKKTYKQTMRSGGTLNVHRSLFVEEGYRGNETTGLKAQTMEFAVPEDETINVAVVMPLTQDKSGEVLAGFQLIDYPVPARIDGQATQMDTPAIILPREVKTIFDAKRFIAKQFGVKPDRVGQMGSSYFCETGVTPQRVYPFVVASPAKGPAFLADFIYAPIKEIAKITFKYCKPKNFISLTCETLHCLGATDAIGATPGRENIIKGSKYKPKLTKIERPVSTKSSGKDDKTSGTGNMSSASSSSSKEKKKVLSASKPKY